MGVQVLYVPKANVALLQVLSTRNMEITKPEISMALESSMNNIFYILGNGESLRWYIGMLYSIESVLKEVIKVKALRNVQHFYLQPLLLLPVVGSGNLEIKDYTFALEQIDFLLCNLSEKIPTEIYVDVLWILIAGLSLRALNFNSCIYRM